MGIVKVVVVGRRAETAAGRSVVQPVPCRNSNPPSSTQADPQQSARQLDGNPTKGCVKLRREGGASERWQGLTLEGPRVRSKQRQQATRRDSGGQSILLRTRTRTRIEEDWVNKLGLVKDEGYTN